MIAIKISPEVLNVLDSCTVEDNAIYLPDMLERKLYLGVNKCLEAIGGKWNRKAKAHLFDENPLPLLDSLIISGEVMDIKKQFQFFPTPRPVAELMCEHGDIRQDSFVLEPSCGDGRLADVIYEHNPGKLFGVELNEKMGAVLENKPYQTYVGKDYLKLRTKPTYYWDRIIMNPPFSKQQDIAHVLYAFDMLKQGGILVAVLSESAFFRETRRSQVFKQWLQDTGAHVIDLEAGAFKESGTMVKTRIVIATKRNTDEEYYKEIA